MQRYVLFFVPPKGAFKIIVLRGLINMKGRAPLESPKRALQGVRIYCLPPASSGIQAGRQRRAAKDGRQRQGRCRPSSGVGKADPVNACYARRRRPDTSGIGFTYKLKRAKARTNLIRATRWPLAGGPYPAEVFHSLLFHSKL